jgi:hypothetical protein
MAAAQQIERGVSQRRLQHLRRRVVAMLRRRRQGPLLHLVVGSRRQVHQAERAMASDRFRRGDHIDPIFGGQRRREALEPSLLIAELVGSRPHAELLAIVAQDREPIRPPFGDATQDVDRILRVTERNRVTQLAMDRKDRESLALIFGRVVAPQRLTLEARRHEVRVIHRHVRHTRASQARRQPRLPHSLGQPQATRAAPEIALQAIRKRADLSVSVGLRNRGQDRLVESSSPRFHLIALHQCAQP